MLLVTYGTVSVVGSFLISTLEIWIRLLERDVRSKSWPVKAKVSVILARGLSAWYVFYVSPYVLQSALKLISPKYLVDLWEPAYWLLSLFLPKHFGSFWSCPFAPARTGGHVIEQPLWNFHNIIYFFIIFWITRLGCHLDEGHSLDETFDCTQKTAKINVPNVTTWHHITEFLFVSVSLILESIYRIQQTQINF